MKLLHWNKEMSDTFSSLPPIGPAEPSVRLPIIVNVPTGQRIARTEDTLTIGWAALEVTTRTVGKNMVIAAANSVKHIETGATHEA